MSCRFFGQQKQLKAGLAIRIKKLHHALYLVSKTTKDFLKKFYVIRLDGNRFQDGFLNLVLCYLNFQRNN